MFEDAIRHEYGDHFRAGVFETMTHELGHVLPALAITDDIADLVATPSIYETQLAKMIHASDNPDSACDAQCHDHRFIRRALHIWFRATAAGWSVPIYRLFGVDCPAYSQPPHFLAELMGELTAMREATFTAIESTEPPPGFTKLWQHNIDQFRPAS